MAAQATINVSTAFDASDARLVAALCLALALRSWLITHASSSVPRAVSWLNAAYKLRDAAEWGNFPYIYAPVMLLPAEPTELRGLPYLGSCDAAVDLHVLANPSNAWLEWCQ
jgi:hypothetical protein